MKSIVKTIIVLGVAGFLTVSSTMAQEASGETSVEAVAETIDSAAAVPSPSKEPVPPIPPPSKPDAVLLPTVGYGEDVCGLGFGAPDEAVTYALAQNTTGRSSSGSKVLVIPDTEIKTEEVAAITQDMQVMSHIFDKIFQGPRLIEGIFMNYGDLFGWESRTTQAIYLQGYGTLFLLEVDFPFSPPPKTTTKEEEPEETDTVWQQARQEVFYPSHFTRVRPSEDKYDAEKVKELKSRLIKSLKHAANIRNIKPEEWVILTVHGANQKAGGMVTYKIYSQNMSKSISSNRRGGFGGGYGFGGGAGGGGFTGGGMMGPGQKQASQGSVMTIRAKKSDIDEYAAGKLDLEQFTEKVQIFVY